MIRPRTKELLARAIRAGLETGYNRAYRIDDEPTRQLLLEHLENAILANCEDWFTFDEERSALVP